MLGREGRLRVFLAFLILVLVLVNTQSLQLSYQSRGVLGDLFRESVRTETSLVARDLETGPAHWTVGALNDFLEEQVTRRGLLSACLLDWNGRLVSGGHCAPPLAGAYDRLDRDGRRELLEEGFAMTEVRPRYRPNEASAFGYFVLGGGGPAETSPGVLRIEVGAAPIAEANQRFRVTLIYQVSAFSLVLLAVVLFVNSLLAPHRRLVAEARSVASELASGALDDRDEGQFVLSTFQDVVERLKQKERELEALHRLEKARADETEALASDIIRSMTTGLVSLDPSGGVVLVNPAAERIFGVPASEARGKRFADAFPGASELERLAREALERGAYHLRGRVTYRPGGGGTLHLGVSVHPLASFQGSPRGALCLIADLTEVVELRERLFLKEHLARLGEMASGIAHEFRNGLATILGNAKLLESNDRPDAREIVEALILEGQALSRVVSEFLQFARPEPLHLEPVHLDRLLEELAEELRPRAKEAGIDIVVRAEPVRLDADEPLLRKAVTNLIVNAMESLTEAEVDRAEVALSLEEGEGFATLRVRDNGPGVPPEHRERIFTPFFTGKASGTGLGLSVVQKIIVSHNGTVELAESPGAGASFVVKLPLTGEAFGMAREAWL